jgi:hypothetical protein
VRYEFLGNPFFASVARQAMSPGQAIGKSFLLRGIYEALGTVRGRIGAAGPGIRVLDDSEQLRVEAPR